MATSVVVTAWLTLVKCAQQYPGRRLFPFIGVAELADHVNVLGAIGTSSAVDVISPLPLFLSLWLLMCKPCLEPTSQQRASVGLRMKHSNDSSNERRFDRERHV